MTDRDSTVHLGLPWPEAYRELRPLLRDKWGVGEDIYLHHKLSGKSGAAVYAADISSSDFSGQAILKLDRSPDPEWQEKSEAERHQQAIDVAPAYAVEHLPKILHTLNHGDSIAILSTIAGRGLEYAKPWAECSHNNQLSVVQQLSRGLLEDWNCEHELARGLRSPQDLLRSWLEHRLDPDKGRLHGFLKNKCGIAPDEKSIVFEGHWYPNPLAFAIAAPEATDRQQQRAVVGNIHGDLHGFNVLVSTSSANRPVYYLIDLAFYQDRQYLFFDHGYFELSHLLMMRERADAANWRSILDHLSPFNHFGEEVELRGDDLGLLELIVALRRELMDWVDRHQANRLSYMEGQYLLARVAAGLNFANKRVSEKSRRMAFLYAAANLKDFLRLKALDWPKHGPLFEIDDARRTTGEATLEPCAAEGDQEASSEPETEHPTLPDRPAIAVLAFENLSGDASQEYFSDGITQEIITTLSSVDWLMVIARGSSFTYKGQAVDVKRVGRELGVHYVVEGSVRRAGTRVRVSVQLIDAWTSHHLWGERYDREVDDIFDLQEEIAQAIAANIDSRLKFVERERAQHSSSNVSNWDKFQHAMWHFYKFTDEHTETARQHLTRMIQESPSYADSYALLALIDCRRISFCEPGEPQEELQEAFRHATQAVSLDDTNSLARVALSRVLMLQGKHHRAIDQAELSVAMNPSSSIAHLCLAFALYWSGQAKKAMPIIDTSIRLSPKGPYRDVKLGSKALCFYALGKLDEAEVLAGQVARGHLVGPVGLLTLAAIVAQLGRLKEANAIIAELLEMWPDFRLSRLQACWQELAPDYLSMFLRDLGSAGLPE